MWIQGRVLCFPGETPTPRPEISCAWSRQRYLSKSVHNRDIHQLVQVHFLGRDHHLQDVLKLSLTSTCLGYLGFVEFAC